jgi:hypothetical protein
MTARPRTYPIDRHRTPHDARSYLINAALAILADGKSHDAETILAEALRRGLVPKSTTPKYLYTALHEYILRTEGAGRIPEFVQIEHSSSFRINRPADDWPTVDLPPLPKWIAKEEADLAIARLHETSSGEDAAAFERAACAAFALLGFEAEHIGGNAQPDGILTAPLWRQAYRVVLECKTASEGGIVNNPRPEEAAKFRAGANAEYSILLGPAFAHTQSFDDELKTHAVSLWTVDDLAEAIEQQITPDELREALAPGPAQRAIATIVWNREHGRRKRVAVMADMIERLGWQLQRTFAKGVPRDQTPALTAETLYMLLFEELANEGVSEPNGPTRAEAEEALRNCESRGTLRKTEDGYYVTKPQPAAKPPLMALHVAGDPPLTAADCLFALLDGYCTPHPIRDEDVNATIPPSTQGALKARLHKCGLHVDEVEISYTRLNFSLRSLSDTEIYRVAVYYADPNLFYASYLFDGARRLATLEGPPRLDLALR